MNHSPLLLRTPRRAALLIIAAIITAASLTSFAESYRGLYLWASRHGLSGLWSAAWPLQVDTFIAVGELALFVAVVDRWRPRSRYAAWAMVLTGLVVSVAGNIGHVAGHSLTNRGTAAVPPLAAAAALAAGLGILKRITDQHAQAQAVTQPAAPQSRKAPGRQTALARPPAPGPAAEPPTAGKDRPPAAPVAPGVPMVPVPPVTQLDRRELATAPHNAARIRHAFTVLGDDAAPAAVARELAAAGYPVHAEHVRSIKKRIHHGRPSRAQGPAPARPPAPAGPRLATATAERPAAPELVPELVPASVNGARAAS